MSYWVYENWTAENKAVIHSGSCGNCNEGRGCHEHIRGDQNGQWLGPYNTLDEAEAAAEATGRPTRRHRCTELVMSGVSAP